MSAVKKNAFTLFTWLLHIFSLPPCKTYLSHLMSSPFMVHACIVTGGVCAKKGATPSPPLWLGIEEENEKRRSFSQYKLVKSLSMQERQGQSVQANGGTHFCEKWAIPFEKCGKNSAKDPGPTCATHQRR